MEFKIEIPDGKFNNVSGEGLSELKSLTIEFVEDVLDESSRIEADQKTSSRNPEITATIIKDAHDYIRKFHIKPKRKSWVLWIQGLAFISTLITGGMFSVADFSKTIELIVFLVIFFISIGSSIILFFKDSLK